MEKGKKRIKREYSAGGAVFKKKDPPKAKAFRRAGAKREALWFLTQPSAKDEPWRQSRWQLPKGWIDEGETGQQAAIREVKEEGGIEAEIIDKIGRINIFFYDEKKRKVVKNIVFFLMKYKAGSEKDHDREIKEAVWLPFQEAYARLTFKSEKEILAKAKKILEEKEKQPSLL